MKILVIALLTLIASCASLDTHNAKAYKDDKSLAVTVIFENDTGVMVREADQSYTPYVYYTDNKPSQSDVAQWYIYNFKTQGIDEREAKALKFLGVGMAADIVTSQLGFSRGCVEKNVLFKAAGPVGMTLYSVGNFALFGVAAHSSTIYQSTLKHDTRKIYAGAAFKGGLAVKNLLTKC